MPPCIPSELLAYACLFNRIDSCGLTTNIKEKAATGKLAKSLTHKPVDGGDTLMVAQTPFDTLDDIHSALRKIFLTKKTMGFADETS